MIGAKANMECEPFCIGDLITTKKQINYDVWPTEEVVGMIMEIYNAPNMIRCGVAWFNYTPHGGYGERDLLWYGDNELKKWVKG